MDMILRSEFEEDNLEMKRVWIGDRFKVEEILFEMIWKKKKLLG